MRKEGIQCEKVSRSLCCLARYTLTLSTSGIKAYTKEQLARLLEEKNFLIIKRKELQVEMATMNTVGSFNILVRSQ